MNAIRTNLKNVFPALLVAAGFLFSTPTIVQAANGTVCTGSGGYCAASSQSEEAVAQQVPWLNDCTGDQVCYCPKDKTCSEGGGGGGTCEPDGECIDNGKQPTAGRTFLGVLDCPGLTACYSKLGTTGETCTAGGGQCADYGNGVSDLTPRVDCPGFQRCSGYNGGGTGGGGGKGSQGASPGVPTIPHPLGTAIGGKGLTGLIGSTIGVLLGVSGSFALLMFVYGGVLWMTAAGNEERVKRGKGTLVWAALGLIAMFISYLLLNFIQSALTRSLGI